MNIIDKNNIPEDIVNDDERFLETTYFLFRDFQLSAEELDSYFEKYHKDVNIVDFIKNKLESYSNYFHNFEERAVKAANSTYLRYFMKDLKRQVSFQHVSQSYTKKMISLFIAEIILNMSMLCHQNIFREKYMDIFEESVDEDHLKNEFFKIIMVMFKPLFEGKNDEIGNIDYDRFTLYMRKHALYLIELDNEEKCLELQKQMQDILSLSNDEVKKIIDQNKKDLHKKIDQTRNEFNHKINEECKAELPKIEPKEDKLPNHGENVLAHKTIQVTKEDINKFISTVNPRKEINDRDKKMMNQLQPIYHEYFMYDQDNFFDYFQNIGITNHLIAGMKKVKTLDIIEYLTLCLFDSDNLNMDDKAFAEMEVEGTYYNSYSMAIEFLNLLSFYLWHRKTQLEQETRIKAFQNIMKEIPECYDKFLDLRDTFISDDDIDFTSSVFALSPQDKYYNDIVLSVLLKIDIPAVSRRIKKVILADYDYYDLAKISKQWTQYYDTRGIDLYELYNMCDLADLFIISYLKDPKAIASYSPFIRGFEDIYNYYSFSLGTLEKDVIDCLEGNAKEDEDPKFIKEVFDIEEKLTELFDIYHNQKDELSLYRFEELETVFNIAEKSLNFFSSPTAFENLSKTYICKLIAYIYMKSKELFFDQSIDEQLDELIFVNSIFHIIHEIDGYKRYMPERKQIQQDTYIESLNQIIHDKEEIIQIKDQQLENISLKQTNKKQDKNKDTKLLEQELKCYKQEISSLNKQLIEKEHEIEELKRNQDELFKLRNLIFSMQQDEQKHTDESVDISSLIQDKNIVIIGGHIHTRDKLKQKYPSLKILAQSSHINTAVLVNADHVFIYYKFMTHDMYNRAISVLSRNNIPWDYIPYTNLEKSEQVISEILIEKYESER